MLKPFCNIALETDSSVSGRCEHFVFVNERTSSGTSAVGRKGLCRTINVSAGRVLHADILTWWKTCPRFASLSLYGVDCTSSDSLSSH